MNLNIIKQFNNIILLFDDLEAKTMDYQNELIELAWHIKNVCRLLEMKIFFLNPYYLRNTI